MEESKLSFMLRAVTDLLPSPTNLSLWGSQADSSCQRCGAEKCSLRHILSACPKSLAEGRFTWRHDRVLKDIAQFLHSFVEDRKRKPNAVGTGIMFRASDWKLVVDIGKRLHFPSDISCTSLRPDIVIISRNSKTIIIAELTVPWEENIAERHEYKRSKYQDLVDEIASKHWKVSFFAIEVGARGFPAKSLRVMFRQIGLSPSITKKACNACGSTAEDASRWLWLKRSESWVS